jgi:regulator of protease activity HflC (stomatin/prohibitin superfamily)
MISVLTIVLIIVVLAMAGLLTIKRIPEGQVYTLRRLGKPAGILTAGTHLVVPLIEHIAHKISTTGYTLTVEERLAAESGPARTLRGRVWWQVLDPERADAVIDGADELIRRQLRDAVPDEDPDSPADDSRARSLRAKLALNRSLRERGLLVTRVELDRAA